MGGRKNGRASREKQVLRCAQNDNFFLEIVIERQRQRQRQEQIQGSFASLQDDGVKQTTATAKANAGVLRFAQDDGEEQATARAGATATVAADSQGE
ncbi:MAG TPA: hypothetical protein VK814_11480 [Acidobacteriaceae bacterium]|jgi:hypothetical protein|nr:hypothetical protein [Acidobacteriaceae bacterium]